MKQVKYEEVRNHVKSGDILMFRKGKKFSIIRSLIKLLTKSPYFHTGIAVWMKGDDDKERLMIVEAVVNSGRRITTLSASDVVSFDVYSNIVPYDKLSSGLFKRIDKPYGYLDLLVVAADELLDKKVINKDPYGEVCSEMVAKEINKVLVDKKKLPEQLSPGKLSEELLMRGSKFKASVVKK